MLPPRPFSMIHVSCEAYQASFAIETLCLQKSFGGSKPPPYNRFTNPIRISTVDHLSQQLFDPLYRFYGILSVAEGGQSKIPFSLTAEALAGCSDHLSVLEKMIEELPAPHALRTFEPDIRRVFAARKEYPQLVERRGDDPRVLFIVFDIGFEFRRIRRPRRAARDRTRR